MSNTVQFQVVWFPIFTCHIFWAYPTAAGICNLLCSVADILLDRWEYARSQTTRILYARRVIMVGFTFSVLGIFTCSGLI